MMKTTIRAVAKTAPPKESRVLVLRDIKAAPRHLFSDREWEYVMSHHGKRNGPLVLNQYPNVLCVYVVGTQKEEHVLLEKCRKAGDQLAASLNRYKVTDVRIVDVSGMPGAVLAVAEGMALGNYQFLRHKSDPSADAHTLQRIGIESRRIRDKQISELSILVDAVSRARDLVNEPVSHLTAEQLSAAFVAMGKEAGFKTEVFNKAKIQSMKMGGLLAVNLGSPLPPTFTFMEYKPRGARNKKPVVLVGKGVVYDTGGLSLKPTLNSMDYMKSDMAGAAAVACALYAVARAKLPVHVIALVPATDNRPAENAYTPGDVITMMSGKTVEVLNTDAEGRMILADALHYAKRLEPELVLDFATLTGAAAMAVGAYGIVCMGTAGERVREKLRQSGLHTYERLAEFPFWDEYDDLLKSDIADMKNIGGSVAGAITAGKFLQRFTDYPWMHFDIAGPAYLHTANTYRGKNATGVGVRLLFDFFRNR
jgi:leucyl aminopeptidase